MSRWQTAGLVAAFLALWLQAVSMAQQPRPEVVEFTGQLTALKNGDDKIGVSFQMDERTYLRYRRLIIAKQLKGAGDPLLVALSDEKEPKREAKVDRLGSEFDVTTGTIRIDGSLSNQDGLLLPGMTVRIRLSLPGVKS